MLALNLHLIPGLYGSSMTDVDLAIRLFLQLVVILAACRLFGWLGRRFLGQTQVVMEMIAGVLLGPSLFGLIWPEGQTWLFPKEAILASGESIRHPSMQVLFVISQVGLVLYMFVVGLEFNTKLITKRVHGAVAVSLSGILVPFVLGAMLAFPMHARGDIFMPGVGITWAALYAGAAMCITAFPMLARIIYEKRITHTTMGTLALGAGATDDAAAWCLLAIVLAVLKGNALIAVLAIGGGLLYAVSMFALGTRFLRKFEEFTERAGGVTPTIFATAMMLLMLCAWFTDAIGIYAVFGAFILGAAMPKGRFTRQIQDKSEMLTVGLLLPTFFAFSGLNTSVSLLNTTSLWILTIAAITFAIVGKGVACALAAKATGEPWRESWTIGTLMNARGLMELIILNIGLQQGVITQTFYTIMVLMAIITTVMASPIFEWLYGKQVKEMEAQYIGGKIDESAGAKGREPVPSFE